MCVRSLLQSAEGSYLLQLMMSIVIAVAATAESLDHLRRHFQSRQTNATSAAPPPRSLVEQHFPSSSLQEDPVQSLYLSRTATASRRIRLAASPLR